MLNNQRAHMYIAMSNNITEGYVQPVSQASGWRTRRSSGSHSVPNPETITLGEIKPNRTRVYDRNIWMNLDELYINVYIHIYILHTIGHFYRVFIP
jgi:hypothetical protein